MTLGEKLQKLRKERGWTQEQLAEQLNVSRQALSKWELGAATPDTENILHMSRLFGVTTDYLLHDEDESDVDLPAVHTAVAAEHRALGGLLTGALLAGLSALGLVILGVIGSVQGGTYHYGIGDEWHVYVGLRAFLITNHLGWFFKLLCVLLAAGLAIIAWVLLSGRRKAAKK